jgi:hypothetical protein
MTLDPAIVIAAFGALVTALGTAARIVYRDITRDRDYWRDIAWKLAGNNAQSIEVAKKSLDV